MVLGLRSSERREREREGEREREREKRERDGGERGVRSERVIGEKEV